MEALSFKTIVTTVRPPRIAVFVHVNDDHWQNTCVRVVNFFTQLWGGHYNIIVPTDGKSIEPQFWKMLEAFSPDYVYSYGLSGHDIKVDQPDRFREWLTKEVSHAQGIEEKLVAEMLEEKRFTDFQIDPRLVALVKDRLIPYFYKDSIVHGLYFGASPHFPLTSTLDLSSALSLRTGPLVIEFFRSSDSRVSDLWLASAFGSFSPEYNHSLSDKQVFLRPLDISENDIGGVVIEAAEWDQTTRWVPFSLCRTGVSYYRSIKFSSFEEPALVVLGGTLRDFCLYQCLSRLRGGTV